MKLDNKKIGALLGEYAAFLALVLLVAVCSALERYLCGVAPLLLRSVVGRTSAIAYEGYRACHGHTIYAGIVAPLSPRWVETYGHTLRLVEGCSPGLGTGGGGYKRKVLGKLRLGDSPLHSLKTTY